MTASLRPGWLTYSTIALVVAVTVNISRRSGALRSRLLRDASA
jgi:hypothetical protein